jgi:hypothetical protein
MAEFVVQSVVVYFTFEKFTALAEKYSGGNFLHTRKK